MRSHHFLGTGQTSGRLSRLAREPRRLIAEIVALVETAGLEVVAHQRAAFDNGGQTFVWVLAESHLVVHHWAEEGFCTIDLHVCDYRSSNADRARSPAGGLEELCFVAGTFTWRELELESAGSTTAAIR